MLLLLPWSGIVLLALRWPFPTGPDLPQYCICLSWLWLFLPLSWSCLHPFNLWHCFAIGKCMSHCPPCLPCPIHVGKRKVTYQMLKTETLFPQNCLRNISLKNHYAGSNRIGSSAGYLAGSYQTTRMAFIKAAWQASRTIKPIGGENILKKSFMLFVIYCMHNW